MHRVTSDSAVGGVGVCLRLSTFAL